MFNTGTVVGVSANIYGSGYQRNFIPSFAIGGTGGFKTYQMNTVVEVATSVMSRKDIQYDKIENSILTCVFENTEKYRNFK